MLALFWIGAAVSAWLGYKMQHWWVPTAVTTAALAGQLAMLEKAGGTGGPSIELIIFGLMDVIMFHATFGIGRSIAQRFSKRRKGAR